jgi:PAS domain S-box-containing protein
MEYEIPEASAADAIGTSAFLSAIVEAAPVALVAVDIRGRIVLVNKETESLFGYPRAELLGRPMEMLVPKGVAERHPALRASFFADPKPRRMGAGRDLFGLRKDGTEVPVEIGLSPIETPQGLQVLAAIVDITQRKRLQGHIQEHAEDLERANRSLEQSNKDLERFAYTASHDLQAPLRAISGFVQLLQSEYEGQLDEQAQDWIRRAVQATQQLQTLIGDMLDYSGIDSRMNPYEQVCLQKVVDDAASLLDPVIRELQARLTCEALPTVYGDRSQLLRLMQKLIDNALKYHGAAEPRVHISAVREGESWVVSVRDNGIGIEPRYHEQVFEIFRRLHDRRRYAGTGIGLAACRRIVERHGGRIWVESEPGQGSVFRFTVPQRRRVDS